MQLFSALTKPRTCSALPRLKNRLCNAKISYCDPAKPMPGSNRTCSRSSLPKPQKIGTKVRNQFAISNAKRQNCTSPANLRPRGKNGPPRHGTMICQAVFHSGRCRDKARGRTKCGSSRSIGATFRFPIRPIDRYFGPVVRRALRRYNLLFILRRRNANEGSDRNLQAGENHGHTDAGPRIGRIQIYSRTEPFAARNKRFVL